MWPQSVITDSPALTSGCLTTVSSYDRFEKKVKTCSLNKEATYLQNLQYVEIKL